MLLNFGPRSEINKNDSLNEETKTDVLNSYNK